MTTIRSIRVDDKTWARWKRQARRDGQDVSAWLRALAAARVAETAAQRSTNRKGKQR